MCPANINRTAYCSPCSFVFFRNRALSRPEKEQGAPHLSNGANREPVALNRVRVFGAPSSGYERSRVSNWTGTIDGSANDELFGWVEERFGGQVGVWLNTLCDTILPDEKNSVSNEQLFDNSPVDIR